MYLIENSLTESSTVSILSNNPYALHNSLQYGCAQLLFMSANYTVPYKRKNNHNSPLPLDLFLEMIPTPKE